MTNLRLSFLYCLLWPVSISSFSLQPLAATTSIAKRWSCCQSSTSLSAAKGNNNKPNLQNTILSSLVAATLLTTTTPAIAYETTDYASDTVKQVIESLKRTAGNTDDTFHCFEDIAAIITEGKGVGGAINYQGVELERGYVSDEDTSIYNPGLTLLTESEKERLVEAILDNRKVGLQQNQWSENNQFAFEFLKEKLDPYHITELRGFLSIVPIYGAFLYLVALAVQQFARDLFPIAYVVAALAFFGPIVAILAFAS